MLIAKTRQGFTLIELLVVISIIAIITAILFPVFAQAREKGRQTSCLSNLQQIGLADAQYSEDFNETLVPSYNGPDTSWLGYAGNQRWMDLLYPYVRSVQVFDCPNDKNTMNAYKYNPGGGIPGTPAALISFYSPGSYAINNAYWDRSDGVYPPTSQGDNKKDPVRLLADLQHPATTIHYSDFASYLPQLAAGQAYAPEIAWPNQSGTGPGPNANQAVASLYSSTPPVLYDLPFRHTGGANVVYCDAHVKFARPSDLLQKNSKGIYSEWIAEDIP